MIRQLLHDNAELSWKEARTQEIICGFLEDLKIPYKKVAGTGIVCGEGPILLRAEMDALPTKEGPKHICGHDVHMAIILKYLERNGIGNVTCVFQPSEEDYPSGAQAILDSGKVNHCEIALAFHVCPELEIGKIGIIPGPAYGSVELVKMTIHGCSAHTAQPEKGVDAIRISAGVMQEIFSSVSGIKDAIIVFSKISGGIKDNIVAGHVEIIGTARALSEESRQKVRAAVFGSRQLVESAGGKLDIYYPEGYPILENDKELCKSISEFIPDIATRGRQSLANEDFAYFGNKMKICLMQLGVGGKYPLHNENFNPPDKAIAIGAEALSRIVSRLKNIV